MSVSAVVSMLNFSFVAAFLIQACKAGRVQHVEQLLFYGADMNQQNSGGNTPLHVCAINNQVFHLVVANNYHNSIG